MKTKTLYLLFLIFLFYQKCILAQTADLTANRKLDSLKQELKLAKYDTAKIRLRYLIGTKALIPRISYWDSLIADADKCNAQNFKAKAFNALGYFYQYKGLDDKAIACYYKSYKTFEETGNKPDMLVPLFNVATRYYAMNQIKNALYYNFIGLKTAEELNNKEKIALFYSGIALCYYASGEINKALNMHLKCLKLSQEMKSTDDIAVALMDIATDYRKLNKNKLAVSYYLETKKYLNDITDVTTSIEVNNAIGSAYLMESQFDSAYKYSNKAYGIALNKDDKQYLASTLALLASINFEKGDIKKAKKMALEALKISKALKFNLEIIDLARSLKKIYLAEKNYKQALDMYELAVNTSDSISNENNRKAILEKEFAYSLEKKETDNKLLAKQNQIQALELKQNTYFLMGMGALLLLVFVIGYLFIRQSKLRNEQQSARLEQKLLLSQMNPHFIFNSLQAIQNFILKHNEKEAVKYLSSFAAITRSVLENSRMEVIPLKKEIALLENYLQLQKLRFKDRFNYEILVDGMIDAENTSIPPMLSQPFIENAIEHGFHDIENGGIITISYSLKNDELIMEINDNGIGMKASSQNKQHRSLALEITKERIVLMNKKMVKKVAFTISEAFPFRDDRKGVKVSFCFPLSLQG